MRLRITNTLGVISLDLVYAPTGISEFSVKEAFYALLQTTKDSCRKGDTLIIRGDFNATTGTDRDGYDSCVGPQVSGSTDESSSIFLDFENEDSWILVPEAGLAPLYLVFQ